MDGHQTNEPTREARLWHEDGWTAKVVKNNDDEGWAVEMTPDGESEPRLTGPWTMGRDKKNPKPLDRGAFLTLVKTASEFVGRIEQQNRARLRSEFVVGNPPDDVTVVFEITPDDDFPQALLTATAGDGAELARTTVAASMRMTRGVAAEWVASGYSHPLSAGKR